MEFGRSFYVDHSFPPLAKGGQGRFDIRKSPARYAHCPLLLKGAKGFTLIELVVVIVLLGITAVTLTSLITNSVSGYLDTANRQESAAVGRIALDRMGRELREAMPQSVRVSADQKCVQFLPIVTSFFYTSIATDKASANVIDIPGDYNPQTGALYAAIYPLSSDELYSLLAMKNIAIGNANSGTRTLTFADAFAAPYPRSSAAQRIYIVGAPLSFCISSAGTLMRSQDPLSAAQPAAATLTNPSTLADHVVYAGSSFTNNASTWKNNSLIKIVLSLQGNNKEILTLDHEVWVRNVQ